MRWAIKSCQESSADVYDDEWTLGGPPNNIEPERRLNAFYDSSFAEN
jgi:hypothetical protein